MFLGTLPGAPAWQIFNKSKCTIQLGNIPSLLAESLKTDGSPLLSKN
jgi:hypothetical protein